ncbi:hypothetical protein VTJ49DRAFT_3079 [Mycothermus thermophilus]|uniref:F-box domain-containing protein n=1 Tax=Humicola insolens TaxID=85995 RepID=A0ABR3V8Q2_HUMIN
MQDGPRLPPEIWRVVAQALKPGNRNNAQDLFLFARVCMGFATLALPELYSVHHMGFSFMPSRWHSVVASTLGTTLFPYYLWITELDLSNLEYFVRKLRPGSPFFSRPLEKLEIRNWEVDLDCPAIVNEIVNLLTNPIRRAADDEMRQGSLAVLKTGHFPLPPSRLATWVSGFPRLVHLQALNVAELDGIVGSAIRANCPAFTDVLILLRHFEQPMWIASTRSQ